MMMIKLQDNFTTVLLRSSVTKLTDANKTMHLQVNLMCNKSAMPISRPGHGQLTAYNTTTARTGEMWTAVQLLLSLVTKGRQLEPTFFQQPE